jgi:chromosome partitioning protein
MRTISVVNYKGGCGKSTSCINLAAYLALGGKKVLLVDLDPQGSCAGWLGINPETLKKSMYDVMVRGTPIKEIIIPTMIENMDLAPCNFEMSGVQSILADELRREFVLKEKLEGIDEYDFIIIDNHPTPGLLNINSAVACTELIIPIQCEGSAILGIVQLLDMLNRIETRIHHKPRRRVLLTMLDGRTNMGKVMTETIRSRFGEEVYDTVIPRNTKLAEMPLVRSPICLYAPDSPGAIAYKNLAEEVLDDQ